MGVSSSSYVVFGLKVEYDTEYPNWVQKFDENTGAPIQKNEPEAAWVFPDGTVVRLRDNWDLEAHSKGEFGFVGPYYESEQILGIIIAEGSGTFTPLDPPEQLEIENKIRGTFNVSISSEDLKYHLISYMS